MSNSVRPHGRQLTRLPRARDSPGKNTGVGCHFLLQCMKVKSESEVTQSCSTLRDPMDYSLPGSSAMGFSRQEYWSGVPLPSLIEYYSESKKKKNRMVFGCRMVVCVWLVYPPATVIAGQTRSHGTMREYHTAEH